MRAETIHKKIKNYINENIENLHHNKIENFEIVDGTSSLAKVYKINNESVIIRTNVDEPLIYVKVDFMKNSYSKCIEFHPKQNNIDELMDKIKEHIERSFETQKQKI